MASQNKHSLEKLSSLCLNTITSNFERFMEAHKASAADEVLQKNFEFLQRAYSKDLFKELGNTEHFVKYMDFLLNKHLKEVDDRYCRKSCDDDLLVERLKTIGEGIRKLYLFGWHYTTDVLLELMKNFPKIESLTLVAIREINDDVLKVIGEHCPSLETLVIDSPDRITELGIMSLCPRDANDGSVCKNTKLKELDITKASLLGITFALNNFPNITRIHHKDVVTAIYNIHLDDIKNNSVHLCVPYKLTELIINYKIKNINVEFVKMCTSLCPRVTKLMVLNIGSKTQIDACVEFKELKDVYFISTSDSASFSSFVESQGKSLESLHLRGGNISLVPLLKFCPKLEKLRLRNMNFEHFDLIPDDVLRNKFQHLKLLSLNRMNFGLEVVAKSANCILSSSPNLETLTLVHAESFSLEFVDSIIKHDCMRTLRVLDVDDSEVRLPIMQKLIQSTPSLSRFVCRILPGELRVLKNMRPDLKFRWSHRRDIDLFVSAFSDSSDDDNHYHPNPSYFTVDNYFEMMYD